MKGFLCTAILADRREWCMQMLRDFSAYIRAVGPWVYTIQSSASAIESHIAALRLVLRVNDVPVTDDFMTKVMHEITKRERE